MASRMTDSDDCPVYTWMTVAKLKHILEKLPDGAELSGKTLANTGNLAVTYNGRYIGFIDFMHEKFVDTRHIP